MGRLGRAITASVILVVAHACGSEDPKKKAPPGASGAGNGGGAGIAGSVSGAGEGGLASGGANPSAGAGGEPETGAGGVPAGGQGGESAGAAGASGEGGDSAGAAGEGGAPAVAAPTILNLPGSVLCSLDGPLAFTAQADGDGLITFSPGTGTSCSFNVMINPDGTVNGTCPSAPTTCTVAVQASNAAGFATGLLTVQVVQSGLDSDWANGGCLTYDGGGADLGWSVDFDSAGRLLVSGYTTPGGTGEAILGLWRYLPDGSPDDSFGNGGLAVYAGEAGGTGQELGMDVLADATGIYVSGFAIRGAGSNADTRDAALWKFTTAGTLDTSFNGTGFFTAATFANRNELHDVALMDIGGEPAIVAAGLGRNNPNWNLIAYMFDGAGQPEAAFDGDGLLTFRAGAVTGGRGMLVQRVGGEDRIVVTGDMIVGRSSMYVQRYTAAGVRDPSFGTTCTGGAVNETNTTCWTHATLDAGAEAIALDQQGRILVAGYLEVSGNVWDPLIWRLTADGLPDMTFGAQPGEWWRRWDGGQSELARGLAVDAAGRIIVSGDLGTTDTFVLRLTSSGELDASFGTGGVITLNDIAGGAGEDRPFRIEVDALGRYYLAGWSANAAGDLDMFVCRLNP